MTVPMFNNVFNVSNFLFICISWIRNVLYLPNIMKDKSSILINSKYFSIFTMCLPWVDVINKIQRS